MISVRCNVFETNSSSTHSMAIPQKIAEVPYHVNFSLGEYGWETGSPDPASYLWTAICYIHSDNIEKYKKKLSEICDKYGVAEDYQMPEYDKDGYMEYGYIDHGDELNSFIDMLFEDDDKLARFIFGGLVFTGNDNDEFDERYIHREDDFPNCNWYYKWN